MTAQSETAPQDDDRPSAVHRSLLPDGVIDLAAIAGAAVAGVTLGGTSLAAAQDTAPPVTGWVNVTDSPWNADNTGTRDATAAIGSALASAASDGAAGVVYLPAGVYLTSGPLPVPHGVTLCGAAPVGHSGDGQAQHGISVIKPAPSGGISAWSAGASVNGVISMDVSGGIAHTGMTVENVWIDGSGLSGFSNNPAVDGIAAVGPVESVTIRCVGVHAVSGNGIAGYSDGAGKPAGWLVESSAAQSCSGYGAAFAGTGSYLNNVRAQQCGHGFSITQGDNRLIGCHAEHSVLGSGFTIDARQPGNFFGSITLIGCGTEGNNQHGLSLINSGTLPGSIMNDPVIAIGCSFDGDGVNDFADDGHYAGISVSGINMLILSACNVTVSTGTVTTGCPQHALAIASNAQGSPMLIQALGGFWNCAGPTLIHPAASPPVQVLSYRVHGFTGGQMGPSDGVETFQFGQL